MVFLHKIVALCLTQVNQMEKRELSWVRRRDNPSQPLLSIPLSPVIAIAPDGYILHSPPQTFHFCINKLVQQVRQLQSFGLCLYIVSYGGSIRCLLDRYSLFSWRHWQARPVIDWALLQFHLILFGHRQNEPPPPSWDAHFQMISFCWRASAQMSH